MANEIFNPALTDTIPMYTPGVLLWDDRGKAWVYVKASEDIAKYAVVMFQLDNVAQEITTGRLNASSSEGSDRLAVTLVDVPDDDYFWAQVYGNATAKIAGAISNLEQYSYSSATAGAIDDNSSGNHRTRNIIFLDSPNAAGTAEVLMNWPGGVRFV